MLGAKLVKARGTVPSWSAFLDRKNEATIDEGELKLVQ